MKTQCFRESPPMNSKFQLALAESLGSMLRPIIRLMLRNGLGCSEFIAIAKAEFVRVASETYGIRGRLTNASRVAAMTGLSRKEVRKIREHCDVARWTPGMEATPANVVIHFWQFDPAFSVRPGHPKLLPLEGPNGFAALVGRYAGDIPVGAMRTELARMGVIDVDAEGCVRLAKRYVHPTGVNEDFIRNIAFSLANLGNTITYNTELTDRFEDGDESAHPLLGRFERTAWTDHLKPIANQSFRDWVRLKGAEFIETADDWIGRNELTAHDWARSEPRTLGVGVYYFEEDEHS